MIELDKLSKTFTQKNGKEFRAVDSVSLTVEKGEICVFLGPSGCGKSTLLKIVASLLSPTEGTILFAGKDIATLSPESYRQQVSYCVQTPSLFGDTVYD
uniref:ATP-binding cassette domain-containing protein n=1 Tax=Acinetobacter nosocomialis TaxID=106654 RepID=UPI0013D3A275